MKKGFIQALRSSAGFTLIEIMISISIIGILAAIGFTAFQGTKRSARDAKRKADMETIRSALEMYKADNDTYVSEAVCDSSLGACAACPCGGSDWGGSMVTSLETNYIQDLPIDPLNNSTYYYCYEPYNPCCNNGYWLRARMEMSGTGGFNSSCASASNGDYFCVFNP
jgi:type II secretion system protein G